MNYKRTTYLFIIFIKFLYVNLKYFIPRDIKAFSGFYRFLF